MISEHCNSYIILSFKKWMCTRQDLHHRLWLPSDSFKRTSLPWGRCCSRQRQVDNTYFMVFTTILTFYALTADDLRSGAWWSCVAAVLALHTAVCKCRGRISVLANTLPKMTNMDHLWITQVGKC